MQTKSARQSWIESLTNAEAADLLKRWEFWARPEQMEPSGNWRVWAIIAGRGFGKTRTGAEWVMANVTGDTPLAKGRYGRIALIAETAADARDVMVEGESGILNIAANSFRPNYEPSKRRLTWPNGAVASTFCAPYPIQFGGAIQNLIQCLFNRSKPASVDILYRYAL